MIHDVDELLRALVRREALNGSRVEIGFEAPTREWSARQNTPTVSLYLYDIREDTARRETNWEPVRGPDGFTMEHRQPPRRFRLSYLITCWTQRPEDEHRLLSSLLACFLRYPVLPMDVLTGALLETSLPLFTTIALPPPADRSIADVWSALGGELKPSLDLVVTAPMDTNVPIAAAPAGPGGALHPCRATRWAPRMTPAAVRAGMSPGPVVRCRTATRRPRRRPSPPVRVRAPSEAPEATPGAGKGKGKKSAETPTASTPPSTALLPGRRIIVRGVRRA